LLTPEDDARPAIDQKLAKWTEAFKTNRPTNTSAGPAWPFVIPLKTGEADYLLPTDGRRDVERARREHQVSTLVAAFGVELEADDCTKLALAPLNIKRQLDKTWK
jgi:hypothetical protein